VKCFAPDGAPRWSIGLRENISPPVALAAGEIAIATPRELILLAAMSGVEVARTPLVARAAFGEMATWFLPAAWNRSVVVGERVVGGDGNLADLRGPGGRRLRARSAIAAPNGACYLAARSYALERPERPGMAPPISVEPMAVYAFGREGEHRWSSPPVEVENHVVAGRSRVFSFARAELVVYEAATGKELERRPFGGPQIALDPADEPIPIAPFGPPLIAAPAVDAAGRRYAAVERGELVGLSPEGAPLFVVPLESLKRDNLLGSLALGRGRLYAIVVTARRRSIVCVGDA
jgi:hypothetical protein